jgi:hypothetical protein
MQKSVRYYIQTSGEQPVVRSVSVDRTFEARRPQTRVEPRGFEARQTPGSALSGVRRTRAAIKRGGL